MQRSLGNTRIMETFVGLAASGMISQIPAYSYSGSSDAPYSTAALESDQVEQNGSIQSIEIGIIRANKRKAGGAC
jgi:hypothetical protein